MIFHWWWKSFPSRPKSLLTDLFQIRSLPGRWNFGTGTPLEDSPFMYCLCVLHMFLKTDCKLKKYAIRNIVQVIWMYKMSLSRVCVCVFCILVSGLIYINKIYIYIYIYSYLYHYQPYIYIYILYMWFLYCRSFHLDNSYFLCQVGLPTGSKPFQHLSDWMGTTGSEPPISILTTHFSEKVTMKLTPPEI